MNRDERKRMVVQYKEMHPELTNYQIAKYFQEMNVAKSSVYHILYNYKASGTAERTSGSGRVSYKLSENDRNNVVKDALQNKGLSQRDLARKYEVSQSYIHKILDNNDVHVYKKGKKASCDEKAM